MSQANESNLDKMIEKGPDGEYSMIGSKCSKCGKVAFMEREICPACKNFDGHKKILIGKKGKINNFTVAHVAPSGYKPPYIVGYVDLDEGPRIFATIDGGLETAEKITIGDKVQLVVETDAGVVSRWKYVLSGVKNNA